MSERIEIVELTLFGGMLQGLKQLQVAEMKEIKIPIVTRNDKTGMMSRALVVFKDNGNKNPVSHNRIFNCIGIELV